MTRCDRQIDGKTQVKCCSKLKQFPCSCCVPKLVFCSVAALDQLPSHHVFFIPIYLEFIHLLIQQHHSLRSASPLSCSGLRLRNIVLEYLMKLLDFIFELMLARQCLNYSATLIVSASYRGTGFLFMKCA